MQKVCLFSYVISSIVSTGFQNAAMDVKTFLLCSPGPRGFIWYIICGAKKISHGAMDIESNFFWITLTSPLWFPSNSEVEVVYENGYEIAGWEFHFWKTQRKHYCFTWVVEKWIYSTFGVNITFVGSSNQLPSSGSIYFQSIR